MQKIALQEGHLKEIVFFEATSHAETSVWPDVQTGGINYWLIDLSKVYEQIEVGYQCTSKNFKKPIERYQFNRSRLEIFPYLLTNKYIQQIVEKVVSHDGFRPIKEKVVDISEGAVYVANTLFRAFDIENKTDDSRLKGFNLSELNGLNNYMMTPFWRSITRQLKTGFHSYENEIFDYIPLIDLVNTDITEEYLENLFNLDSSEKEYLKDYGNNNCALP